MLNHETPKNNWLKDLSPRAWHTLNFYNQLVQFSLQNPIVIEVEDLHSGSAYFNVKVFGGYANWLLSPSYGNGGGVRFTYGYSTYTYGEFLVNSMSANFKVGKMRIESQFNEQLRQTLNFRNMNPDGTKEEFGVPAYVKLNQYTEDAIEIDTEKYPMYINGDTEMYFRLGRHKKVKFYFYPSLLTAMQTFSKEGMIAQKYNLGDPNSPIINNRKHPMEKIQLDFSIKRRRPAPQMPVIKKSEPALEKPASIKEVKPEFQKAISVAA